MRRQEPSLFLKIPGDAVWLHRGHAQPDLFSIQLFGFESRERRISLLWENPRAFSPSYHLGAFLQWKRDKRSFSPEEVTGGSWLYISLEGKAHLLQFFQQGATQRIVQTVLLFDMERLVYGDWSVVETSLGVALQVSIPGQSRFVVVASRQSSLHSGLLYPPGQAAPLSCKFLPIKKHERR